MGYTISDFLDSYNGNVTYMGNSLRVGYKSSVTFKNHLDKPIVIRKDVQKTQFTGTRFAAMEDYVGWGEPTVWTEFRKNVTVAPGKTKMFSGKVVVKKNKRFKANVKTESRPILSLEKVIGEPTAVIQEEYPESDPISGDRVYLATTNPPPVNAATGAGSGQDDDLDLIMMIVMLILAGGAGYTARGAMTRTALGF